LPGDYYHFDPVHHRLAGERTGRSFRLGDTVEVRVMRVDLDERKIDFEMSEKTTSAPVNRKNRPAGAPAAGKPKSYETEKPKAAAAKASVKSEPAPVAKPAARRSSGKGSEAKEAYRSSDAAAKNAEVRKSRELKQALLAEAKAGGKPARSSKSSEPARADSGKPPTKHRKGPSKSGSRKPKAKS
jgi:ribonuclease R